LLLPQCDGFLDYFDGSELVAVFHLHLSHRPKGAFAELLDEGVLFEVVSFLELDERGPVDFDPPACPLGYQ
jgi:hypothetical protein